MKRGTSQLKAKSSMKRTSISSEPKPAKGPKQVACRNRACRKRFVPSSPAIRHCSEDCGAVLALEYVAKLNAARAKAARAKATEDRKAHKKALDKYKTIPQLKAELQEVFNRFIRLRDYELPCICCGKWPNGGAALVGGQWDAAHWKGRGAADHLRYNEDNVNRALKDCNEFGHTDYRGGLVKKIGLARVEALECNQTVVKWTREWLEERKEHYARMCIDLRAKLVDKYGPGQY